MKDRSRSQAPKWKNAKTATEKGQRYTEKDTCNSKQFAIGQGFTLDAKEGDKLSQILAKIAKEKG